MSTYSNLKIEEITLGDSGWGTSTTNNLLAIQQALQSATLATGDFTANVATLPWTNTSATTNTPRAMVLNITATLTGAGTVNLPAITGGKAYLVINASSGGYAVTVKVTGLTGVSVPNGKAMWLWNNGTDVVDGVNYISSLALGAALPLASGGTGQTTANAAFNALAPSQASASGKYLKSDGTNTSWDQIDISTADITGTLPIANGGTGATTATTARTGLGATTLGGNLFTITDPGAVTFPRFNADNTVSALNAADFRTAIGAGTGGGSVSSVALAAPAGFAVGGSPVTSSGTLTLSFASGYALPTTASQTTWDTAYTERLQWDGGSTSLVAATGRTSLGATTLGSNLFTITDPGAITFPRFNADNTVSSLSATAFRTAIGATTLGSNLFTITNPGAVTFPRFNADNTVSALSAADFRTAIGAGTGGGSVTGVTATAPLASSGGTAPDISLNANYGDALNPYASKTANYFLAAPNGITGAPSFRAIVAADIPTLNQNTTGSAATANALNTSTGYQVGSFGVGTAASGTTGEIRATNNVTAYYSSDIKFKENVRDITGAALIASEIGGKYFDWTDAYIAEHGGADGYFVQKQDFGVIAQDVQRVFPRAVRTRPDGSLAVDYEKLSALALAAVSELVARVAKLEARG